MGKGEFEAGAITGYWIGEYTLSTYLQWQVDLGGDDYQTKQKGKNITDPDP